METAAKTANKTLIFFFLTLLGIFSMNAKKTVASNLISKLSWEKVLLYFLTEFQFSFWIYNIWCGVVKYVYALIFCSISNSIAKIEPELEMLDYFPTPLYAKF